MAKKSKYDIQHEKNLATITRKINELYSDAIADITVYASHLPVRGELFSLSLYPGLAKRMDLTLKQMSDKLYTLVVNGINGSWDLSNIKNDVLVDKRLAGKVPKDRIRRLYYDPNKGALDAFINRKEKGLGLSKRVWNTIKPFKQTLEASVGVGISEGQSASQMAKDIKKYLNEPDKLFRRVRDNDGRLRLSKEAKEYNPGQGIYRSSYKNAKRLARSETNMAYRTADHERWQNMNFVIGIRIQTSDNHPKYDICDRLAGVYPKDFKWTGFHPQCICYATPEMLSDKDYDKYENMLLGLEPFDDSVLKSKLIQKVPDDFDKYVEENKDRIKGWKNKPYWIKDNKQFVSLN